VKKQNKIWLIAIVVLFAVGSVLLSFYRGKDNKAVHQASVPAASITTTPEDDPVQQLVDSMTLHEKICQMFIVHPENISGESSVTAVGDKLQKALSSYPVGGFLLNTGNMESREQITKFIGDAQKQINIPLFIACDEEGGRVSRLMRTVGTTKIGAMLSYREDGAETAEQNAKTIGEDMHELGLNLNFAPVADVFSNPENKVIGDRAYSTDFEEAAELVSAAVMGFHKGGVLCTLKHFPGHGNTTADSHDEAVYIGKSLHELRKQELLPFRAGIDAGADMVMLGHLTLPELDENPAPLSHRIVTDLLREEMGFEGVIITDSLQMQAITDHYSSAEISVKAVTAGVDMLLCPMDLAAAAEGLTEAVKNGTISPQRIDESVYRILTLKFKHGLIR